MFIQIEMDISNKKTGWLAQALSEYFAIGWFVNMKINTHFKETAPEKTVAKLKGILHDMGIPVVETWLKKSSIDTYSLRVTFKGTNIGTNGKGVDKKYAEASAYAELFERYQNLIINSLPEADNHETCGFFIAPDEKILSTKELLSQGDPFFETYFKLNHQESLSIDEKAAAFTDVNISDETAYALQDKYISLPYYSVLQDKLFYLPKSTTRVMYGSNGMCAGNTPAEALVQGISEIFERVSQKRILFEKPCLPDVPEEYIKKFPDIYKMYKKLQSVSGYLVTMKDCSFGGKYPVAGLLIVEKNTGHYGLKLGCHPDFGIAMERTFTEATQGGDIREYANRSIVDFGNANITSLYNISNSFTVGFAQYPYEILKGNSEQFVPVPDVSGLTNAEILDRWIQSILKEGYDILIRDVSTLGFPSFHVVIPGLTEMDAGDATMRARNTRAYVTKALIKPSGLEKTDIRYILGVIGYYDKYITQNAITGLFPYYAGELPYNTHNCGLHYLAAMCYASLGNYAKASMCIHTIEKVFSNFGETGAAMNYICALKYYFQAMQNLENHSEAIDYLRCLFDDDICEKIRKEFAEPKRILSCQYHDSEPEKLTMDSPVYIMTEIMNKMRQKQRINRIDQMDVRNYLKS